MSAAAKKKPQVNRGRHALSSTLIDPSCRESARGSSLHTSTAGGQCSGEGMEPERLGQECSKKQQIEVSD
jgi:hypothetical protein